MNHTWLSYKVGQESKLTLSLSQISSLRKLVDDQNAGLYRIDSERHIKLFCEQVSIGLEDIYERFHRMRTEINARDSSSLLSFQIKYGETEGKIRFEVKRARCVQTLENFINRYGEDAGPEKYNLYVISKLPSKEGFVYRHGKLEGEKQWKEYWETTKFGTSLKHFISRFGDEIGQGEFDKFKQKQAFNGTLEGYISKYGAAGGVEKFVAMNNKKGISGSKETMVQRLLDSGMTMIDVFNEIDKRWNNTSINAFTRRYGESEGRQKYDDFVLQNKINNPVCIEFYTSKNIDIDTAKRIISTIQSERSSKNKSSSKESLIHLGPIAQAVNESFVTRASYEFPLYLNEDERKVTKVKHYRYDLVFPEINIIIEYHGAEYHEDIDYNTTSHMSLADFSSNTDKDLFKKWVAEQRGYRVFVLRNWAILEDKQKLFCELLKKGMNDKWKTMFI